MSTTDSLISGLIFHAVFSVAVFVARLSAAFFTDVFAGFLLPCLAVFLAGDFLATAFLGVLLAADFFAFFAAFLAVALAASILPFFAIFALVFLFVFTGIGPTPSVR